MSAVFFLINPLMMLLTPIWFDCNWWLHFIRGSWIYCTFCNAFCWL